LIFLSFEKEQALKTKYMSGSGPSDLRLYPSTVKRSQLFKAYTHTVIFSILEEEVMYETIRATTLSQKKIPVPTACPLIVAESRHLTKSRRTG